VARLHHKFYGSLSDFGGTHKSFEVLRDVKPLP
jgi:hypothetical protein